MVIHSYRLDPISSSRDGWMVELTVVEGVHWRAKPEAEVRERGVESNVSATFSAQDGHHVQ